MDDSYRLYSCKVAQYCGFAMHRILGSRNYWVDTVAQELAVELPRSERANKRRRR